MSGVYIHIPLCHSKCAYCDFYSRPGDQRADEICRGLAREFVLRRSELTADPRIRTIYLGGGTPSILSPEQLAVALAPIPRNEVEEFTIEVNPEDVTEEKTSAWRHLGINRVSMGIQSFVDSELREVGRRHSASQATEAVDTLRRGGFDNISLDLIYGLPGQTLETWRYSVGKLLELHPEHFSAYALSYEEGTRLAARVAAGRLTPTDDDTIADMYELLTKAAAESAYKHYEISNYALEGRHSRHNSSYWDSTPYLGLGPGAHSFDGTIRRYNPSDTTAYLAAMAHPEQELNSSIDRDNRAQLAFALIDDEDDRDRLADVIFTRLRTAAGLPLELLDAEQVAKLLNAAKTLPPQHLINTGTHLRIPEHHWLISDAIIRHLLP